ncbi:isotrichodermin C-15 hydroxylase [Macrophomina phaseolina]|uniref:Isotrichodermin C-15 hydroxylase n=1 Tax=Macrophomina phaseolina TaxID=35725 RepID=A0ABQ8FU86_9PEZI|nr:isotrichodermin C-15 hydroxylase [Macrophomina phaseolina]
MISALGILGVLLLYPAVLFVYNVFLHPLRKYPGPTLAAATSFPFFWRRLRGDLVPWYTQLHKQYGSVVRVAPNQLSYTTAEAWKDIYGHKTSSGRGNLPRDLRYYGKPSISDDSIIHANDLNHSRIRRLVSHAFSDRALSAQTPLVKEHVELLVEKIRDVARAAGGTVDLEQMSNFVAFDVIADLTFGESLGLLKSNAYTPWVASIFEGFKFGGIVSAIKLQFPLLVPILQATVLRRGMEKRAKHAQFTINSVEKRLSRRTDRPDIWTFILRHNDEKGLARDEMYSLGSALMIAGTETTATLLSGLFYYLCCSPEKLRKLNDEIRNAFPTVTAMDTTALARLPYLHAVVMETFRLYPPAPQGFPRRVPEGGSTIAGRFVPEKTTVNIPQYAAYHQAHNFYDPESFRPERWLPEPEQCFAQDSRDVVEPFGTGPRNCVGKNLAWMEIRLLVGYLIFHFDFELSSATKRPWTDQKSWAIYQKGPLLLNVKPRVMS